MYAKFLKRVIDLVVSLLVILFLMPLFFCVSIVIYLTDKGSVFYSQDRVGFKGELFELYKFRSMYENRGFSIDKQVFGNDKNITPIGRFIRRFKIDELAQLINVIKGDMSLVGPRPCLPSLREKFNEDAYYRLRVKPGLTGLAQINGNIFLSWEKRWEYDRKYVESLTFFHDIKIILKTVLIVFLGEERFKK